jgi:hypothetical protein
MASGVPESKRNAVRFWAKLYGRAPRDEVPPPISVVGGTNNADDTGGHDSVTVVAAGRAALQTPDDATTVIPLGDLERLSRVPPLTNAAGASSVTWTSPPLGHQKGG